MIGVAPVLIKIIAFTLIFAMGIVWVAIVVGLLFSSSYIYSFLPLEEWETSLSVFNIFILVGVPLLFIVFFILRIVYRSSIRPGWKIAMGILWFLSLGSLGFTTAKIVKGQQSEAQITTSTPIPTLPFDTLKVDFAEDANDYIVQVNDVVKINSNTLAVDRVRVSILESEDENFHWGTSFKAKGATPEEAALHAEAIDFDLEMKNNYLILPKYLYISDGRKWYDQKIFITIWVPVGKYIEVSDELLRHKAHIDVKGKESGLWHGRNGVWRMEAGGLVRG